MYICTYSNTAFMVLSLLMDVLLTRHTGSLCSVTQVGPYAPLYEYYPNCVICACVYPCV